MKVLKFLMLGAVVALIIGLIKIVVKSWLINLRLEYGYGPWAGAMLMVVGATAIILCIRLRQLQRASGTPRGE